MQHLYSLRYVLASSIWNYLENEFLIAAISNPEYMYHLGIPLEQNSLNKFEPYRHAVHGKHSSQD